MLRVKFKRLDERAIIPTFGAEDEQNAGLDLFACEEGVIPPGQARVVGTGVAWEPQIEDLGTTYSQRHVVQAMKPYLQIKGRSGLAFRNGIEASGAGVVDAGYRGEIKVLLRNTGTTFFRIEPGDRIAQAVIHLLPLVMVEEAEEITKSARGSAGFGSTGR